MSGKIRKAINFDLNTDALKEFYCETNNPFERLKAYGKIKKFMKENGFIHKQWSGYISEVPVITYSKIKFMLQEMYSLILNMGQHTQGI